MILVVSLFEITKFVVVKFHLLLLFLLLLLSQAHAASSPSDRYLVLLDAAAYLPTHTLDLTAHPADFVAVSFYKMFGYPTGLGALVLRTDVVPQLHKAGAARTWQLPLGCRTHITQTQAVDWPHFSAAGGAVVGC